MSFFSIGKTLWRSVFSKPATVRLQQLPAHYQPRTRGHIRNNIEECIFCRICEKKCPAAAIRVKKPEREWSIDRFACVQCNCCVEVCPKSCLHTHSELPEPASEMRPDVIREADA